MKKSLMLAVLSLSALIPQLTSACDKFVDPNKVMLFIDTNLSLKEVEAARKGACDRGERFVLHPNGELADKARRTYYKFLTNEEYYDNKCKEDTPACDKLYDDTQKLKNQMKDFDFEEYKMNPENIKKVLQSVKDSQASISTLIVSGHDGGGEISGDYIDGSFSKIEFFDVYDSVFGEEGKKDLHSILLWGCYTGTYSEAKDWKSQFSSAKSIVGFYDSAPLAIRPASTDLMLDFLQKEFDLYKVEDEKELKKSIQNLKSILYTQPGMMINACHDEEIYYSHYQDDGRRKTFYLTPKDAAAQCELIKEEWKEKQGNLSAFLEGSKDIPDNIRGSEIRLLYGFVRQNEKCLNEGYGLDANKVGLLLFWNGVKENFIKKYEAELLEAQKELDEIISKIQPSQTAYIEVSKEYGDLWRELRYGVSIYSGDENLEALDKKIAEDRAADPVQDEISKYKSKSEMPEELQKKIDENVDYLIFYQNVARLEKQKELKVKNDKLQVLGKKLKEAEMEASKWSPFGDLGYVKFPGNGEEKYTRADLVRNLRRLNDVFPKPEFQAIKAQYPHIEKAYKKMDQLLYQLDPSCMNFLEWHQYNPNKPLPNNQCEGK